MDISGEPPKNFVSSSSVEKNPIYPKHGWCEFPDSANHFPDNKKKLNFPQTLLLRNGLLEFPVFQPNMLSSKLHLFSFRIRGFDCGKNFHVSGINGFDGNLQIRFHTIFYFFNAFHWEQSKTEKKKKNHNHY